LGVNVREARQRAGVSQERLAHESGIARSYLSTIERGLANLALDHLVRLAEMLDVDPSELVPTAKQIASLSRRVPKHR
jgi:transcriptional regulator with XRE-family HTH domain